jgi:hypothetical protein
MTVRILTPVPGVIHLVFPTMKALTTSMFRMEEFYESPHAAIQGQYFSVATFLDVYADDDGDVRYFRWWDGFNVPRAAIDAFERLFRPQGLTEREQVVLAVVHQQDARYLIATSEDTDTATVAHEVAHARWAVDPAYRAQCEQALTLLQGGTRRLIVRALLKADYPDDAAILEDEIHAYLMTDPKKSLRKLLKAADASQRRNYLAVRKLLRRVGPEGRAEDQPA